MLPTHDDCCGLLLAGGRSTRMRRDKALLSMGEQYFISRIAGQLRSAVEDVLLSCRAADDYAFLGLESIADMVADAGPLGGIHAAFHHSDAASLLVVPCDLPFITSGALRCLLAHSSEADIVYAADAEESQPLVGVYQRSILSRLEEFLSAGERRLHDFLELCTHTSLRLDRHMIPYQPGMLRNINTPADYHNVRSK